MAPGPPNHPLQQTRPACRLSATQSSPARAGLLSGVVRPPEAGVTEVEWLACEDSKRMFEFLQTALSTRKARLLAVGCCRLLGDVLSELQGAALDAGEAFADDPGAGGAAVEAERAVARANAGVYTRARQSAWAGTWW